MYIQVHINAETLLHLNTVGSLLQADILLTILQKKDMLISGSHLAYFKMALRTQLDRRTAGNPWSCSTNNIQTLGGNESNNFPWS